ncbi:MAG TPA: adenylate/guanylate cyclase domain-containing protein [Gaiellaceae bacterium]|nr:adenylate/guanylate cyclase domain-containing protein [Gaiellaceae bacterium]
MEPDIRYARNGDVAIAYQVVGSGERDLVLVPDFMSNLVYLWESRYWREFYERLARSFRLILFDKRGTGLSDRGTHFPALETRMEDMRAVLDSVGSDHSIVFGSYEGGGMAALYAATYPERTDALVLFQFPPYDPRQEYPARLEHELDRLHRLWGTQQYADELLATICPTLLRSEADRLWFANCLRVGASPEVAYALNRAFSDSDLREVLPAIRVPTLVLTRGDSETTTSESTARLIPNARLAVLAGSDYWGTFLSPEIVEEIETFVATLEADVGSESVLATILFTDLVGSTAKAAELGDRRWRELLEEHHARTRRELVRYRGTELDTAGDGFFARFDGPARAIRCAGAIRDSIAEIGLDLRAGVHTGECEVLDGKVTGIAVSIGARVAAEAGAGEVLVSQTVKDLVAGSGLAFDDRGVATLKGVPGEWRLFAVG